MPIIDMPLNRLRKYQGISPCPADIDQYWDRAVGETDLAEQAYEELRQYFRYFDPRHEREDDKFGQLGYIDLKNLSGRIRAQVLMATALMDKICPLSTQFAMYNQIKAPKKMVLYPDFGHEELPGFRDMTFAFFCRMLEDESNKPGGCNGGFLQNGQS